MWLFVFEVSLLVLEKFKDNFKCYICIILDQSCVFGNSIILNLILVIFYLVIFTVI